MKNLIRKIALVSLLLCVALSAKSQIYLGGNIGLAISSGSDARLGVIIAPEIGYSFHSNFTVGASISYRSLQNSFGITPYLRGTLFTIQDFFSVFLSAQTPCRFTSGYQSLGAYIRPGVSFRVAPGIWLMAHIGAFGYSGTHYDGYWSGGWVAKVNSDTVNIGVCFNIGA